MIQCPSMRRAVDVGPWDVGLRAAKEPSVAGKLPVAIQVLDQAPSPLPYPPPPPLGEVERKAADDRSLEAPWAICQVKMVRDVLALVHSVGSQKS